MNDDATTLAHRALALERAADGGGFERWFEGVAERALRERLGRLAHGTVTLVDGASRETYGMASDRCALSCTLHVRDRRFYTEVAFGGSVGAGESFMAGDWTCEDLTALVRILLVNRDVLDGLDGGRFARASGWARRVLHAAARNTRTGSRRNIGAHYDIGNDFFELFLGKLCAKLVQDLCKSFFAAVFAHT